MLSQLFSTPSSGAAIFTKNSLKFISFKINLKHKKHDYRSYIEGYMIVCLLNIIILTNIDTCTIVRNVELTASIFII